MPNQGIGGVGGNDILQINGVVITGHADGDAYKYEPQGDIAQMKISKDGNTITAPMYTGLLVLLTARLVRGCPDDQMLNGLLQQWIGGTPPIITGEYIKATYDNNGNIINEVNVFSAGTFKKIPAGHTSMDGATDASVIVYELLVRHDARLDT